MSIRRWLANLLRADDPDLRTLRRASAEQARHAHFVLQAALPLNRDEVEPW